MDRGEKNRRMSNYRNQFKSWAECMRLVQRSERSRGAEYDTVIKLRDNSIVLAPLDMGALKAGRRVRTKSCSRFGGVNDKVAIMPREHAEAYMNGPYNFVQSVRDDREPYKSMAKLCSNTESILLFALNSANVPKETAEVN